MPSDSLPATSRGSSGTVPSEIMWLYLDNREEAKPDGTEELNYAKYDKSGDRKVQVQESSRPELKMESMETCGRGHE